MGSRTLVGAHAACEPPVLDELTASEDVVICRAEARHPLGGGSGAGSRYLRVAELPPALLAETVLTIAASLSCVGKEVDAMLVLKAATPSNLTTRRQAGRPVTG